MTTTTRNQHKLQDNDHKPPANDHKPPANNYKLQAKNDKRPNRPFPKSNYSFFLYIGNEAEFDRCKQTSAFDFTM